MSLRDYTKWNTRASLLYALGVWTMIGAVGVYKYMGYDVLEVVKREEEPENPNRVVHSTPHSKTVIIYKENFVPYHTRIYNFFNGSDGK
ncbi:unnamed protein product [Boreogadus saida]